VRTVPEMIAKEDVKGLIGALANKNPHVRYMAAVGLGLLGDRSAVEPLRSALADEDHFVQQGSADALLKLGQPVEPGADVPRPDV
jgi:HEAT repeat protein